MNHFATPDFWYCYRHLPAEVREFADEKFALLRQDPHHPSLRLKKVGSFWSARVGLHYRVLARDLLWIFREDVVGGSHYWSSGVKSDHFRRVLRRNGANMRCRTTLEDGESHRDRCHSGRRAWGMWTCRAVGHHGYGTTRIFLLLSRQPSQKV